MKQGSFSRNLAIVYTLIIAIPLMIFILIASEYLRRSLYESVAADARKIAADNAATIGECVEQIERIESIITSDYDLLRILYFSESIDDYSAIENLIAKITDLERLQYAMPKIYSIHLFVRNPIIPERWPTVFSESRLDFSRFHRWSFNYRDETMFNQDQQKLPSGCLTREVFMNKRHVGYLQISMKMTDMFPFLYAPARPWFRDYAYANGSPLNPPVSGVNADGDLISGEIARSHPEENSGSMEMRIGNENRIIAWERIPRLGLLLIHTASPDAITDSISAIRLVSFIVLFLSILGLFGVINFTTRKMFTRLYRVMDGMRKVREGNLDVSVRVSGSDEVAEMAQAFNSMVSRIGGLVGEITREQALVTQTEIKAMQNQINAHFLYNALETIKMQAELRDQREIAESVTLLGRMMRYCLRWKDHRVTVAQEIDYVRDYVAFMNIRNDYVISLAIDIPDPVYGLSIPKMLVQPVVENAVRHAIEPEGEDAVISISAVPSPDGNRLFISVRDVGPGLSPESLEALMRSLSAPEDFSNRVGGIGLRNIQDRLHAFYGPDFSLSIASEPGKGTAVRIPVAMEVKP
jgi:two-component system sensor histidine kinase YesM